MVFLTWSFEYCVFQSRNIVWYHAICNHEHFYSARFTRLGLFVLFKPDLTQSLVLYVSLMCKFLSAYFDRDFFVCAVNTNSHRRNVILRTDPGHKRLRLLCTRRSNGNNNSPYIMCTYLLGVRSFSGDR